MLKGRRGCASNQASVLQSCGGSTIAKAVAKINNWEVGQGKIFLYFSNLVAKG